MHAHIKDNKLKEEEELQEREKALKKREEELTICERESKNETKSLTRLSIALSSRPSPCNGEFHVLLSCISFRAYAIYDELCHVFHMILCHVFHMILCLCLFYFLRHA
jgi:hypothetical protein